MKRDCGQGELKPIAWEVVSTQGKSDDETVTSHATLDFALATYEARVALATMPCSNVRLYAKDKQGYANCIKSFIRTAQNEVHTTSRLHEL